MKNADKESPPRPRMTLVVGWGSELMGDDAVGRCVARELEQMGVPEVLTLDVHQLTPELAWHVAEVDRVFFVDAYPAELDGAVRVERLHAGADAGMSALGHYVAPEGILSMAHTLYGARPEAWLVAAPAGSFEPLAEPTAEARRGIRQAVERVCRLIRTEIAEHERENNDHGE